MAMPSGFAVIECSTAAAAQKVFPEEWHALLLNEIVGERQGGMKILSAMRCTILGKIGYSFEREVCIGDQFSQAD
jgi:hypothetical protein